MRGRDVYTPEFWAVVLGISFVALLVVYLMLISQTTMLSKSLNQLNTNLSDAQHQLHAAQMNLMMAQASDAVMQNFVTTNQMVASKSFEYAKDASALGFMQQ